MLIRYTWNRPGHAPEFSGTYRNYPHVIQEHRIFTWYKATTGVPQIPRYRHHEISISHNHRIFPLGRAMVHQKSKTLIKCTSKQHWYGAVFNIHGQYPVYPYRQGMRTTKGFTLGLDQRSLFRPDRSTSAAQVPVPVVHLQQVHRFSLSSARYIPPTTTISAITKRPTAISGSMSRNTLTSGLM